MITPTCQVCGTTLNLENGTAVETVIRRGLGEDDDPDYDEWHQELCFRFCGEQHMKSWMTALSLPAYEPPAKKKASALDTAADALLGTFLLVLVLAVLTGAVYGFLLLLARVF